MTQQTQPGDVMVRLPLLGALTYREWHAVVDGTYAGVRDGRNAGRAADHGYDQEAHYWRAGWLVGVALRDRR